MRRNLTLASFESSRVKLCATRKRVPRGGQATSRPYARKRIPFPLRSADETYRRLRGFVDAVLFAGQSSPRRRRQNRVSRDDFSYVSTLNALVSTTTRPPNVAMYVVVVIIVIIVLAVTTPLLRSSQIRCFN